MRKIHSKTNEPPRDAWEFPGDRSLALAAQERLSKIRAQHSKNIQSTLREARALRREIIKEAKSSLRGLPS